MVRSIYISYMELVMQGFAILILVKKGKETCTRKETVTLCTTLHSEPAALKFCEENARNQGKAELGIYEVEKICKG